MVTTRRGTEAGRSSASKKREKSIRKRSSTVTASTTTTQPVHRLTSMVVYDDTDTDSAAEKPTRKTPPRRKSKSKSKSKSPPAETTRKTPPRRKSKSKSKSPPAETTEPPADNAAGPAGSPKRTPGRKSRRQSTAQASLPDYEEVAADEPVIAPRPASHSEPQYPFKDLAGRNDPKTYWGTDETIKELLDTLLAETFDFASKYVGGDPASNGAFKISNLSQDIQEGSELARIVGCFAVGGPNGASGWEELFVDPGLRVPLVAAVIGRVLIEHVIQTLYFGGTLEKLEELIIPELIGEFGHRDGPSMFPHTSMSIQY